MAVNGEITLAWVAGEHVFNVAKLAQVMDIEAKTGSAIGEVFARLGSGLWAFNDIRETIRNGLIGGGMKPEDAMKIVKLHVDPGPWYPLAMISYRIVQEAMIGVQGDNALGKKDTADQTETGPKGLSDPPYTEPARQ